MAYRPVSGFGKKDAGGILGVQEVWSNGKAIKDADGISIDGGASGLCYPANNTTLLSNWNLVLPVRSESKWAHGMSARRGRPSIGRQEKRGGPDFRRSLVQSDAFLHPVADARALCVRDVRQTISSAVGEY